jgi:hypothetical protein
MTTTALCFIALLFTALSLSAAFAHALELRNKMKLTCEEYLIAQKLHRGWEWLGLLEAVALFSALGMTSALAYSTSLKSREGCRARSPVVDGHGEEEAIGPADRVDQAGELARMGRHARVRSSRCAP